jgi:hypothetical protein
MGFDQKDSTRRYRFDRIEKGEATLHLVIAADLNLFLMNRVAIQEGPVLCAKKLTADLEQLCNGKHSLTNDDLVAYTCARAQAEAQRTEARLRQPKRRTAPVPAPASRTFLLNSRGY